MWVSCAYALRLVTWWGAWESPGKFFVKAISSAKIGLVLLGWDSTCFGLVGSLTGNSCSQWLLFPAGFLCWIGLINKKFSWPELEFLVGVRTWCVERSQKKFQAAAWNFQCGSPPVPTVGERAVGVVWAAPALEFLGYVDKKFQCGSASWGSLCKRGDKIGSPPLFFLK